MQLLLCTGRKGAKSLLLLLLLLKPAPLVHKQDALVCLFSGAVLETAICRHGC